MSEKKKNYSDEFKKQIIALHKSGKPACEILKEYGIAESTFYKWIKNNSETGSFRAKDNRTALENELIEVKKTNKRLLMENDILKQAALLMARK